MNPDGSKFFGTRVSKQGIPIHKATDNQLVYKDDFSTKTYYDNTTARMLEGKLPNGSYGLQVSPPGTDVRTAKPIDLIFNSSQDIFKIVETNTVFVGPLTSTLNWATIPHHLGFAPIVMAYVQNSNLSSVGGDPNNGVIPLPTFLNASIGGALAGVVTFSTYMYAEADAVNVYIVVLNATGGTIPSRIVKYYLLQESASQ